uniref:Protein transport protein sec16 n=1 Tax=Sinocyclocheilus grahami TaxID=75366 RepID=A0A672RMU1_SINGR
MQPPPRTAPPGASGPPPPSGGPNAFRRTRPHKHGAAAAMGPAAPPTQQVTDPFAFGRQSFSPMAGGSQAPLTNNNPLPMQGPPLPGFNPMIPPQGPTPGAAQAASPGPPPRIFTPQPVPPGPAPSFNPLPAEPGYFNSQEPMPYIAQLPNPAPSFSSSSSHPPSTGPTPPVQSQAPFQYQPTPPLPSHWVPDQGSRPPSVQNYFQPTSDLPSQPFQAQAPPPVPSPHTAPPVAQSQNQGQSAQPNVTGPAATQQQNSHFLAQNYFSQSVGPSEPWFNQNPQDPSQRACPVSYSEVPSDSGTLSMFFRGNDVENKETLSGEGRVNGIHHPFHSTTEFSGPYLNDTGNIRAGAGPCDSVENQECVPNQEVLPCEPPPGHSFEGGPNLETLDTGPCLARSASVSSSYSNVSHSSGHGPHSGSHIPRRQQGVMGTFIQQESPRPPDHPPLQPSTGGYFEQIDSNPAAEASPTFPTPSPPKPVGVFQASANSSFEPVRSHGVGVRPAEVDRARMVMEKGGRDMQPGNLERPPDNLETIYLPERRPSSRAQGARCPIESPATTLWAQNDTASLGVNILLAPAAPSLAATFVPAHHSEVIQPPEDGPLDLHPAKPDPQPPSENLEIPPDSTPQASLGYASLLVTSPPVEALNQPVLIAPPSSLVSSQNLSQPSNQTSPRETATPVHPPPQFSETNQMPQNSPPTNHPQPLFSQTPVNFSTTSTQGILNLAREAKDGYDDPWRYYPGYDSSFDDECRRRDPYTDDFDRRSVHSEQSAHSVHSSHSRRSSFSSRSQQVCVCFRSYCARVCVCAIFLILGGSKMIMNNFSVSFSNFFPFSAPPRPLTPEKFSVPHRCARFGPAGQLILVQPNLPSAGQPTLVEIHSMETILQDSPEQSEMRSFPGPLVKEETHKVDVIKFAQNKAQECLRNDDLIDKDSAYLIWEFIVLLCRQNGTVVGTDIADLLLKEHRSVWLPGKSPNEANLIDFNNEAIERAEEEEAGPISLLSDTFMGVPENVGKETERFRELLLFGRKKDALESAMKNGLWGHALLLASKMDNRTHARVMTRFANSLPINDPLQTVYQLMSGRMPAAATCCGDEKWGDWRPHLAMVLSNLTHTLDLDTRTISTMGDTLASKGLVDAAHFCYLMAQVGFGVYTKKSTKMVLIGSNHSLQFLKFCSSEAIQRTESYEYAQSLCSQPLSLPNFQVFKFIYACRLAEAGLCAQAFHYCEVISRTLLSLPEYYSAVFISQLIQMSLRLRFFDPQMKERPEQELFIEPDWLLHLRQLDGQIKVCVRFLLSINHHASGACYLSALIYFDSVIIHHPLLLSPLAPPTILQDGAVPLQQAPSPGESVPFYPVALGPPQPNFAAPFQPEMREQYMPMPPQIPQQIPQQMPPQFLTYSPTEMPPQMPPGMPPQMLPPMPGAEHGSSPQQFPQSSPTFTAPPPQGKDFYEMARMVTSGGWLTWLYPKRKNEAHLPDDKNKSIVWDEMKQKWVNMEEPEEESKPPPPPPTGFPKAPMSGMGPPGVVGPAGGPPVNMFSRRAGSRYVDVLNPGRGGSKPAAVVPPPADLFAPLAPMAMPANLFTPAAGVYVYISVFCISVYVCVKSNTLSRSSSMSSLSREVSQHLNQVLSAGSYLKHAHLFQTLQ